MARPLDKIVNGKRLTRRPEIEAAIEAALNLDTETIRKRAANRDASSAEYIPTECLLHLIRRALRESNQDATNNMVANRLMVPLLQRCEVNLLNSVSGSLPNAEATREEIMARFSVLIAEDLVDPKHKLDFFEVRFNKAFKFFRIDCLRAELRQVNRVDKREDDVKSDQATTDDDTADETTNESTGIVLDLDDSVFRKQMMRAINALPEEQRKPLILHFIHHFKIESEDPNETTVATLCKVSGRTIRKRLAKAMATLAKLREAA